MLPPDGRSRRRVPVYRDAKSAAYEKVRYTKEMQEKGYTILAPQMAPIHFELVEELLRGAGYNVVLLPRLTRVPLTRVCAMSTTTSAIRQFWLPVRLWKRCFQAHTIDAHAVLISQTGGGCRATNYIALIRKALKDAGHPRSRSFRLCGLRP